MTSINELFPKCRKLAYDARQQLAVNRHHSTAAATTTAATTKNSSTSDLYMILEELNTQLNCMETLLPKEIPHQRMIWQRKIVELRQESQLLYQQGYSYNYNSNGQHVASLTDSNATSSSSSYSSEREELLQLRQRRSACHHHRNQRPTRESDLHNLSHEAQSIESSHSMVLDLLQNGEASFHELRQQRKQLYTVSSIMSSINNTLGLSKMTIEIIERRDITDAYYVLAGMIITCVVLYVTWFI
jgi:golgi SNAP receptor complex member 2